MARKCSKADVKDGKGQNDKRSPKTIWHPLNLQNMPVGQLVILVNQILEGKKVLFEKSLRGASATSDPDEP